MVDSGSINGVPATASHYLLTDRASEDLTRLYSITTDFLRRTLAPA